MTQARTRSRWCRLFPGTGALAGIRHRFLPGLVLGLLLATGLVSKPALAQSADETSVHAAYLINFVRYTKWPATHKPNGPYVIVVIGGTESAATMRQLAARAGPIGRHPVVVRSLSLNPVAPVHRQAVAALRDGVSAAHVVYVAASHHAWNDAVIAAVAGRPVLTVGVGRDFVTAGGMFGLIENRGRVNFNANEAAIRRAPIDVSARVLLLARSARAGD